MKDKKVNSQFDSFKSSTLKQINILCFSLNLWVLVHRDSVSSKILCGRIYTRSYI